MMNSVTRKIMAGTGMVLIVVLMLIHPALASDGSQSLFQKGNEYYQKQDYADAAKQYEALTATGLASPEVYYNLGNCYFKTGDIAHAMLNYERANKLQPDDDDIDFNIRIANLSLSNYQIIKFTFTIVFQSELCCFLSSPFFSEYSSHRYSAPAEFFQHLLLKYFFFVLLCLFLLLLFVLLLLLLLFLLFLLILILLFVFVVLLLLLLLLLLQHRLRISQVVAGVIIFLHHFFLSILLIVIQRLQNFFSIFF